MLKPDFLSTAERLVRHARVEDAFGELYDSFTSRGRSTLVLMPAQT